MHTTRFNNTESGINYFFSFILHTEKKTQKKHHILGSISDDLA